MAMVGHKEACVQSCGYPGRNSGRQHEVYVRYRKPSRHRSYYSIRLSSGYPSGTRQRTYQPVVSALGTPWLTAELGSLCNGLGYLRGG
jgi:hypothetical protein